MSTLQELIRYCNEDHHLGALLLTGEWGCGKTYLIEQELAEALRATHIVRVSLLGVDSVEALNEAIRQQWLLICTPFLGKLKQEHERLKKGSGFFEALSNILLSNKQQERAPERGGPFLLSTVVILCRRVLCRWCF